MSLMKNDDVKLILYAGGGDFLMEMLEELDFEEIILNYMYNLNYLLSHYYVFQMILE